MFIVAVKVVEIIVGIALTATMLSVLRHPPE
jgi:hypothetical protein